MPETLQANPERHEALPTPEQLIQPAKKAEKDHRKHERSPRQQAAETAKARHKAEAAQAAPEHANPLEKLKASEAAAQPAAPVHINRELKAITRNRMIHSIQRKLPTSQRTLSRFMHQPAVRVVSDLADKTVSRPSGLLGGSLVAFLGTTGYFWLAKAQGFDYNYLVFLALFIGGFAVGLLLELAVYVATSSRRHSND